MNKNRKEKDIVYKMGVIGIIGVLAIIIAIIAVSCLGKENKNNKKPKVDDDIYNDDVIEELKTKLGVIKGIDTNKDKLILFNIEDEEILTLNIDSSIEVKDSYGTDIAIIQLQIGDIIEAKYNTKTLKPEYIHISGVAWERKADKNLKIDEEKKTIQIANDLYRYTDDLVTVHQDVGFKLEDITEVDEIIVKGYRDVVWTIRKVTGHGFIRLKNYSNFIGGTLEIGNRKVLDITEEKVMVKAGVYTVVISKENMTPYVTEVFVEEGQEVVIDVGDVGPKIGTVDFDIAQDNALLYIDGELADYNESIELDYGEYEVEVTKANYTSWKSNVVVNQAYMKINIDLEKEPSYIHVDNPIGCELYIDAAYIGKIPVSAPIDVGEHTVTIRKEGYFSKMETIYIKDNVRDNYFTFPELVKIQDEGTTENDGEQEQ